jgi:hypothetical protein
VEYRVMHQPSSEPSLVPTYDATIHLVLDDFAKLGRAYLETDESQADRETVVHNLLVGEYRSPIKVIAFNTSELWSRDVSEDIAREVVNRAIASGSRLPESTHQFVAFHLGEMVALRADNALL